MFDNYEELTCIICEKAFVGRRPGDGGDILCFDCISSNELPVVNDGDDIPNTVHDEISSGGGIGDNGQN